MDAKTLERFNKKVLKRPDGCWIFDSYYLGEFGSCGFYYNYQNRLAHRIAYEIYIGPIPRGAQVIRTCGDNKCVKPKHMELKFHKVHTKKLPTNYNAKPAARNICEYDE